MLGTDFAYSLGGKLKDALDEYVETGAYESVWNDLSSAAESGGREVEGYQEVIDVLSQQPGPIEIMTQSLEDMGRALDGDKK